MTGSEDLLDVGDVAAGLALVDLDGEPWRVEDQRGRPVLLVFHRHVH